MAAAFAYGADGVEVDLRLTADGVLAVCHDPDLGRLTGAPLPVAASTWPELSSAAGEAGVALARFEDVLLLAAGRRVVLEVKRPTVPAAVQRTALALAEQLLALQRAGVPLDVTVSSFSPTVVRAARELLAPRGVARTALLGRRGRPAAVVLRQALEDGHDEMHPHVLPLLADPSVVAAAHACGVAVVGWTVNRRQDVQRLQRLGVDGVITDVPAYVRAATGAQTTAA